MFSFTIVFVFATVYLTTAQNTCGNQKLKERKFFKADNKALQKIAYGQRVAWHVVICVGYCHADLNCQSVNYHTKNDLCELNNVSRVKYPDNFVTHHNSVYFDADAETALITEHSDSSFYNSHKTVCNVSGIAIIHPAGFSDGLQVYCHMDDDSKGWIVIQRRQDGSVDFYRDWTDYRVGFGNLSGEFWLGNDNLRSLTESTGPWRLRVEIEGWDNETFWADFGVFQISGENFTLLVDLYNSNSTIGNSLSKHSRMMFSTKDRDNDKKEDGNCAQIFKGGWWYTKCYESNLNGKYFPEGRHTDGIVWRSWKDYISIKKCTMKICPS